MKSNTSLEIKVGLFVLLGLVTAGILIVSFGRFGELFQKSYRITVQFADTSGVIKNSQVLYRGARVGTVVTPPEIADQGRTVEVGLTINRDIKIDRESSFDVGSYGLLGDRFIDVQPPSSPSGSYLEDGDVVQGEASVGLGELAERINPILAQIEEVVASVEEEQIVENLGGSMASVRELTAKVDRILAQAEEGDGPIFTLLNDQATAQELRETITEFKLLGENLRRRGILFYKDVASEEQEREIKQEASSGASEGMRDRIMRARDR